MFDYVLRQGPAVGPRGVDRVVRGGAKPACAGLLCLAVARVMAGLVVQ